MGWTPATPTSNGGAGSDPDNDKLNLNEYLLSIAARRAIPMTAESTTGKKITCDGCGWYEQDVWHPAGCEWS